MGSRRVREQVALTGPTRLARRRRWLRRGLVLATVLLSLYLTRTLTLPWVARFLDVSEPPAAVDDVLVLGGGLHTRPFVAAALVRAGLARRVLVPAVRPSLEAEEGLTLSEPEALRRILRARGVPADAIVQLAGECTSTFDEAGTLAAYLDREPNRQVIVVTTTHHTRRARWIFRRVLGERSEQVRFVAAPPDGFDATNWWRHEAGWVAYANEYVKLAFYLLRY